MNAKTARAVGGDRLRPDVQAVREFPGPCPSPCHGCFSRHESSKDRTRRSCAAQRLDQPDPQRRDFAYGSYFKLGQFLVAELDANRGVEGRVRKVRRKHVEHPLLDREKLLRRVTDLRNSENVSTTPSLAGVTAGSAAHATAAKANGNAPAVHRTTSFPYVPDMCLTSHHENPAARGARPFVGSNHFIFHELRDWARSATARQNAGRG